MPDPVTGTIAAVTGGGALIGANAQRGAAKDAARASQQATDQSLAFQRYALDQQTRLAEPFRQFGIQQANALGEVFGFNPVSQGGGVSMPNAASVAMGQRPPGPAEFRGSGLPFGQFAGAGGGTIADVPGDGFANPAAMAGNGVMSPEGGLNADAQARAQERFDQSLFNRLFQTGFQREMDAVDANLAASGLLYSGTRQDAKERARADTYGATLNNYLAAMMGQPSTAGAQMQGNAFSAFSGNASNLLSANAANQAQSAYQRGQATSGLVNNLAGLAAFGIGQMGNRASR